MKNLSPAAQQVFWAFNEAASGKPDDWHYLPSIAAALEAAVNLIKMDRPLGGTDADAGVFAAHHAICSQLLAIANELKAD